MNNSKISRRDAILEYMGGKCSKCGYNEHKCALDIHHKKLNTKHPRFYQIYDESKWEWNDILAELSKCVLLCANCHRHEHRNIGVSSRNIVRQIDNIPVVDPIIKYYSVIEICTMLNITEARVLKMIKDGVIPSIIFGEKTRRVSHYDLQEYLESIKQKKESSK